MKISGPFLDSAKKDQPKRWFLRYAIPKVASDGTLIIGENGKPVLQRVRPYYESKAQATADIPRIREQHATAGSTSSVLSRESAAEYDQAKGIVGGVSLVDVARFWRRHHPEKPKPKLRELLVLFLTDVEQRLGAERHWSDRKSRLTAFLASGFSDRFPETIERADILSYVMSIPGVAPRTRRNHKTAICEFFNWMMDHRYTASNPAAGIRKRMLPREEKKEIAFLSLDQVERYLRAAEHYDPEIVAHEIVQLVAGVRADDEMSDFRAEFVLPQTKEIVIPASVAKTEAREVINSVEPSFWAWWEVYGPKAGLLRPKNYGPRWDRIRILATRTREEADELAKMPIKQLKSLPVAEKAIEEWPWNARRRTFCTYHVALNQSADKTALIMRHRGSPYTLHNSYRGLGVTQEQGRSYFSIMPQRVANVVRPARPARGVIVSQMDRVRV